MDREILSCFNIHKYYGYCLLLLIACVLFTFTIVFIFFTIGLQFNIFWRITGHFNWYFWEIRRGNCREQNINLITYMLMIVLNNNKTTKNCRGTGRKCEGTWDDNKNRGTEIMRIINNEKNDKWRKIQIIGTYMLLKEDWSCKECNVFICGDMALTSLTKL